MLLIAGYFLFFASEGGRKNNKQPSLTPALTQTTKAQPSPKEVNLQASFSIFTNGTKRIFTETKYHDRDNNVFITKEDPEVIHIKKSGVTWQNFFDTLPSPMKVSKTCLYTGTGQAFCNSDSKTLKFLLNDKLDINALDKEINNGDNLKIDFGSN